MTREDAEDALAAIGGQADAEFPLFEAVLNCALHETPERDALPARTLLRDACERLRHRLQALPPDEALYEAIGNDLGLSGDLFGGDRLLGIDLIDVCERRCGAPIALAVICLEVAQRCSMPLAGVDFPGGFLLRVETAEGPVALDPFASGQVVMPSELVRRALRFGLPPNAADDLEHLMAPISPRMVALRLQDAIFARANAYGDYERAERAALRRGLLDPTDPRAWLDVATAREGQGQLAGVLQALAQAQRVDPEVMRIAGAQRTRVLRLLN
jgi:regulator of sirC expression with transglutaminase-like and TPR domain